MWQYRGTDDERYTEPSTVFHKSEDMGACQKSEENSGDDTPGDGRRVGPKNISLLRSVGHCGCRVGFENELDNSSSGLACLYGVLCDC